ncbi:MAG: hypothetical protein ACRDJC_03610, partial [Thermomicrobiales bacterium]
QQLVALDVQKKAQDPRIIFDSLRPLGDELWNMIDGERTVGEITEAACLEFGFTLDPDLFGPLFDGLIASEAVEVASPHPPAPLSHCDGEGGKPHSLRTGRLPPPVETPPPGRGRLGGEQGWGEGSSREHSS